jgi:hypothetical protein
MVGALIMDFFYLRILGTNGVGLLFMLATGIETSIIGGGISFGWFRNMC